MKTRIKIISAVVLASILLWFGITFESRGINTNQAFVLTNAWTWSGTNFLTISNRPYVQFEDRTIVVRVTDAEWNAVTNHYPDKLRTNSISFWSK